MVFVFDLDDTACETDAYSEEYMLKFFKEHNLPYNQIAKEVRFAEKKFDWSIDEAIAWYKEFGDDMMREFPCKANAVEIINELHDAGPRIVIATARAKDWHTDPEGLTLDWLAEKKIKYDNVYIGRIDKEKICEEEKADVFIDDDISITTRVSNYFQTLNLKDKFVFLSTTSYNKNLKVPYGVERVASFDELLKKLKLVQK